MGILKRKKSENKKVHLPREEKEYPQTRESTTNGHDYGYTIQARHNAHGIFTCGGQQFDNRWAEVNFKPVPEGYGVPGYRERSMTGAVGLYSYEAAQALRWWLHAEAANGRKSDIYALFAGGCLETRIVKHKMIYSYTVEAVSHHEHVGGDAGDYSSNSPSQEIEIKQE